MAINQDTFTGPSFSLKNRVLRLLWGIVYNLFFRFSPRPCHVWRAFLLKLFGANLGRGCHIYPKAVIWAPWNLSCGDETGVADHAILYTQAPIYLGKRCVISQGSHLCTGTHDYTQRGFPLTAAPIIIGDDAWVAAEAFVHGGVTIGAGSVIAARAVVNKDIPEWMICAGHPCKPIKPRVLNDE